MHEVVADCHGASKLFSEDDSQYGKGWSTYDPTINLTRIDRYFIHHSAKELDSMPTSGIFDTYSGMCFLGTQIN